MIDSMKYPSGPILICLVNGAILYVTHVSVTIFLPMLQKKYRNAETASGRAVVTVNCLFYLFLLVNVLFNFGFSVCTKHSGSLYDRVVRKLARATEYSYPETQEEVASCKAKHIEALKAARKKHPNSNTVRSWILLGPLDWGYCEKTQQPKPPRAHYDKISQQLVLNMDHYCPWIWNAGECTATHVTSTGHEASPRSFF